MVQPKRRQTLPLSPVLMPSPVRNPIVFRRLAVVRVTPIEGQIVELALPRVISAFGSVGARPN